MYRELGFTGQKQLEVALQAMVLAFKGGASFTVEAFCMKFGQKPNRHTRAVLNKMAAVGMLSKHKTLFDDGKYRMLYAANLTRPLAGFLS